MASSRKAASAPVAPARRKRPVTIKDIAAHLGVHYSAVSRALNDQQHTSDDLKRRVREAVRELGYVPHSAARMLHRRHSPHVGLVLPDLMNQVFAESANILAERCHAAGYQLVLAVSQRDPAIELQQVEAMREMRVAGVIIAPCGDSLPETEALLAEMRVVQLARRNPHLAIPTIATDDRGGAHQAMRHLLQLGHRRIGVVGGDRTATDDERYGGALDALAEAGVAPDPRLLVRGPLSSDFGRQAASQLLQAAPRPTALLATNSLLTQGMVDAAHRAQLKVPQDLSLVGFGDPAWFRLWGPGLTTVRLPIRELAEACALQLLRQIEEDDDPAVPAPFQMMLDTTLVLRGSTGPAPPA